MTDKAFNLVSKTQIETVTFAGQGGTIPVAMALEAAVVLADWSEPVKGLEAASFWSSAALMAQQFLSTDSSFCILLRCPAGSQPALDRKDPAGS